MFRHTSHATCSTIRRLLGAALLLFPIACGDAQGSSSTPAGGSAEPARASASEPYRLTAPVIEKVSAIMNEWNPQGPEFMHPGHEPAKWKEGTAMIHSLVGEA